MAIIQSQRPSTSGGGGGLEITGFANDQFTQEENFASGEVVLTLSQTPVDPKSIRLDYNGQTFLYNVGYSYSGGEITILFSDPYVEEEDAPPVFQVTYAY